jgi:hypothetical protein
MRFTSADVRWFRVGFSRHRGTGICSFAIAYLGTLTSIMQSYPGIARVLAIAGILPLGVSDQLSPLNQYQGLLHT